MVLQLISPSKNIFSHLEEYSQKSLTIANEHMVEICGIERIMRFVNGQWHSGVLNDVPILRRNLFIEQ